MCIRDSYNISRSYAWFWRFMGRGSARWEGEAMTDADGKFSVPVHFEIDSDRRESVSYTHLDVYKRQDYMDSDDAVDIIREMDEDKQEEVLSHIEDIEQMWIRDRGRAERNHIQARNYRTDDTAFQTGMNHFHSRFFTELCLIRLLHRFQNRRIHIGLPA